MNKVILMGRLTNDPDVRVSQGERQMSIARYTLAVDRRGARRDANTGEQTADFIRCVAFDRAAEFAERYFRKGMRVLISGRIQTGSYQNREGQTVYTTDVIIEDQEFADSKGAAAPEGFGASNGGYQNSGYSRPSAPQTSGSAVSDGFMNIPDGVEDEGLPFN